MNPIWTIINHKQYISEEIISKVKALKKVADGTTYNKNA